MDIKTLLGAVAAISLIAVPAERVEANAGDFIAGAIVGGLVGANAKNRPRSSGQSSAARQEGREIQASLNFFGFNAGAVDGQLGRKTRQAVSQYQAYLGYPVTGQLSDFEKSLLTSSYNRAQAGGLQVQQAAVSPEGTRSLLKAYRAEMAGQPVTAAVAPAPAVPVIAPAPVPAAPAAPVLPNFMGAGNPVQQASLASHCNTVSVLTNTNGGYTTLATMTDPKVVLNEQFCLARVYAMAQTDNLVRQITGFTPDQIAQQCEGFAPALKPHVEALATKGREETKKAVIGFVASTGMTAQQMSSTARICLGVGYRTDSMDVAVGSLLLLDTLGEPFYGELVGHHLALGFGTDENIEMADEWYRIALSPGVAQLAANFIPDQPGRPELVRAASERLSIAWKTGAVPAPAPAGATGVPVFSISE
ncbi:MAG: peptidoglycan-binding domain-containing protein [Pseudomonadota bacterium]